jgi:uncharacterized protein
MLKIVFWIVVVFVVLMGLRMLNVAKAARRARERQSAQPPAAETMVRCARCGVYLPRGDAKPTPGGLVCTDPACAQRR